MEDSLFSSDDRNINLRQMGEQIEDIEFIERIFRYYIFNEGRWQINF